VSKARSRQQTWVHVTLRSVAGSLNGLLRPCRDANRRFPFHWWAGGTRPIHYAMKVSVSFAVATGTKSVGNDDVRVRWEATVDERSLSKLVAEDYLPLTPATAVDADGCRRKSRSRSAWSDRVSYTNVACGARPRSRS
jgi:hypothetical protein